MLESQCDIELELSRFDSRLEDVEMNVRVLVGGVEYVNNMLHRMEQILVENFGGMHNYLGNMRITLIGMIWENEERSETLINQVKTSIDGMEEEMDGLMVDIHGMIRTLEPTDHPSHASPMEGISSTIQGAEKQLNEANPTADLQIPRNEDSHSLILVF